jgi:hypothetical protein
MMLVCANVHDLTMQWQYIAGGGVQCEKAGTAGQVPRPFRPNTGAKSALAPLSER